jgi:hypothetical protein
MAEDWARRQQAARERWVEVGGKRYRVRRPLELDVRRLLKGEQEVGEALALEFVVGWEGFTEADLVPGVGGEDAVEFSAGAYREWIGDRFADLTELARLIWDDFQARQAQRASIPGKSSST